MQDSFQECFIHYKTMLREYLAHTNQGNTNIKPKESASVQNLKINSAEEQLPMIQLPVFSGRYMEWQSFYDMFVSLIHDNNVLSPVQKLRYLKSSLSGEPEALLKNYSTTVANYKEAWGQLTKRYNNKRYICNAVMKTLFGQKNIHHESSAVLRQLLDVTNTYLQILNT